jgi:type II secretion system protein J
MPKATPICGSPAPVRSSRSKPAAPGSGCNSAVEVLYWPYLDIAPGSLPAAYALADGITRFRVEYLDSRGATHERWPVSGEPALPRAVRVTLTLAGGETVERWLVLQ